MISEIGAMDPYLSTYFHQFEVFFSFQLRIMELPTLEAQDQPETILFDLKKKTKIENTNGLCVSQELLVRKPVFAVSRCCFVLSIFWNRGKPSNSDFGMLLW